MGLIAPVVDGKLQDVTSSEESSLTQNKAGGNSSLDKDAFLQLLVAQMKYQDPLEPTSNTEFISQFATFSELEEMQNMRLSMDLQRAQDLVGKEVIIRHTNAKTGNSSYEIGKVESVVVENGKAYLMIKDQKYPLDELDQVVDPVYMDALNKGTEFVAKLQKLPAITLLTTSSMKDVFELKETYDAMTDYEKSFFDKDVVEKLDKYVAKMKELMELEGLTYEKEEQPTTEDLLQDLLDKIDKIIGEMGSLGGGSGEGGKVDGEGETGGNSGGESGTDDTGKVEGETGGNSGGEGGTDDTGKVEGETGGNSGGEDGTDDTGKVEGETDGSGGESTGGAEGSGEGGAGE